MLGMHSCEMSFSSTLEGAGHIRTSIRSRNMKIDFAILNSMYRLRMPISTAYSMCEANKSTAQPKDDDLTEHYEFNWCLRSPRGIRLLLQSFTQYDHDALRTRCEKQASGTSQLQVLPTTFGVCFGKAAIIRPRAPPPGRQTSQAREKLG